MVFVNLGQALRDADPEARTAALRELDQMQDPGAVRMIFNHARQESEEGILKLIGSIAKRVSPAECIDLIKQQLETASDEEKCRLLFVMKFIHHTEVFALAAELFGHADQNVTRAAFRVLRRLQKQQILGLLGKLTQARSAKTRSRIMGALAKLANGEVVPYLTQGLADRDYEVRKAAYDGLLRLQEIGLPQAAAILADTDPPRPPQEARHGPTMELPLGEGEEEEIETSQSLRLSGVEKLKAEGKICRTCTHMRRSRPDGKKMAQVRLWCNLIGKETLGERSCPRGNWK